MIYLIQPETVKRRKPVSLCLAFGVMLSRWEGRGGGTQKNSDDEDGAVSAEGSQ